MLSLVFRDKNGIEQAFTTRIYDLSWSATEKGGPLSLTAAIPIDVLAPKFGLLQDVSLYDGLDEIWLGRIRETPSVSLDGQAAMVVAEGYINHLDDDSWMPRYIDARLDRWDDRSVYGLSEAPNPSRWILDKNNRIAIGTRGSQAYVVGDYGSWTYGAISGGVIKRITTSYACNYTNTQCYMEMYAYVGATATAIWRRNVNGSGSGSIDISTSTTPSGYVLAPIPANCSSIMMRLYVVGAFTASATDKASYARLTSPKIYYASLSDYKTTTVLKDILTNKAPKISTDYSKVVNGAYTLPEFLGEEKRTPLDLLRELNSYEGYDFGIWDRDSVGKPRLTFTQHERGKVHYVTSLDGGRPDLAGDSIESQYNSVDVEYQDGRTGSTLVTTRTASHQLLSDQGVTRSPQKLSLNTTSSAAANRAGDMLLADKARPQGKGSLTIRGYVSSSNGRRIPAHQIKPGTNILVHDLRASIDSLTSASGSNVLNGSNVFRIVQVDAKPYQATLQLDNEGDRLDFFLARKRLA